jgi:hypothetical protein
LPIFIGHGTPFFARTPSRQLQRSVSRGVVTKSEAESWLAQFEIKDDLSRFLCEAETQESPRAMANRRVC